MLLLRADSKVFFMHVPKTAGTSISVYLQSLFRQNECCPSPEAGIWTMTPEEVGGYKLYCGHFDYDFVEGFGSNHKRLTMLRHPVDRVVSVYDFWRSFSWHVVQTKLPPPPMNGPAVAKSCGFLEFLKTTSAFVRRHISNQAARQLLGHRFDELECREHEAIKLCVQRLEKFDWVGITEEFPISMQLLAQVMGKLPPPVLLALNRTYQPEGGNGEREVIGPTILSEQERAMIENGNRLDLILYEEALRIFRTRVSSFVSGTVYSTDTWSPIPRTLLKQ